jgi:hypothetical protein
LPFVSVGNDPELYTRSMQYAAFSAQLRPHAGKTVGLTAPGDGPPDTRFDRRAWEFPYEFFGPMREAMQLRSRLLPYTYSAALRAWLRCDETKRAPALFVVNFLIESKKGFIPRHRTGTIMKETPNQKAAFHAVCAALSVRLSVRSTSIFRPILSRSRFRSAKAASICSATGEEEEKNARRFSRRFPYLSMKTWTAYQDRLWTNATKTPTQKRCRRRRCSE